MPPISWKLKAELVALSGLSAAVCLALPVVAQDNSMQGQDQQNGPNQPWSNEPVDQQRGAKQLYGPFEQERGSKQPYGPFENSRQIQPYTPPPGGYSSSYRSTNSGYGNSEFTYGPSNQTYNQQPTGIVSSRAQTPSLPEGLVLPIQLDTSIDTDKAQPGDYVQVHVTRNISAGGVGYLPGSSVFSGTVVKAPEEGKGHSAKLSIDFMQVRLPNGTLIPMKGHLVGRIESYLYRSGENPANRAGSWIWKNGLGGSFSYGAGSAFGSFADGGRGPGSGAYAGAFMGGASSMIESLVYRHHNDIFLHPGTRMELQLDDPLNLPGIR